MVKQLTYVKHYNDEIGGCDESPKCEYIGAHGIKGFADVEKSLILDVAAVVVVLYVFPILNVVVSECELKVFTKLGSLTMKAWV